MASPVFRSLETDEPQPPDLRALRRRRSTAILPIAVMSFFVEALTQTPSNHEVSSVFVEVLTLNPPAALPFPARRNVLRLFRGDDGDDVTPVYYRRRRNPDPTADPGPSHGGDTGLAVVVMTVIT